MNNLNLPQSLQSMTCKCHGQTVRYFPFDKPAGRRRHKRFARFSTQPIYQLGNNQVPEGKGQIDVSSVVVQPQFRSTPWKKSQQQEENDKVKILLVSESNVCRSVFAELFMKKLIKEFQMEDQIECASKGSRDYNEGEGVEEVVISVGKELDVDASQHVARKFDAETDIVLYDLVLVVDKFTAADVLREVTVYDTIDKAGGYSKKVRKLGGFTKAASQSGLDQGDIDDPLYGNVGGDQEKEAVREVAVQIEQECRLIMEYFFSIYQKEGANMFGTKVRQIINQWEMLEWLVPPMLSK